MRVSRFLSAGEVAAAVAMVVVVVVVMVWVEFFSLRPFQGFVLSPVLCCWLLDAGSCCQERGTLKSQCRYRGAAKQGEVGKEGRKEK